MKSSGKLVVCFYEVLQPLPHPQRPQIRVISAGTPVQVVGYSDMPVLSASSGTNTVAIDNKIEQAMDLVKSHLMFAVREEVDVLKEKITELLEKITQLEHENGILKANATPEMLNQLNSEPQGPGGGGAPPSNPQQPPPVHEHQ